MVGEGAKEGVDEVRVDVFGHLEAPNQVELAIQIELPIEIPLQNPPWIVSPRNSQRGAFNALGFDSMLQEEIQSASRAAANVERRVRLQVRHHRLQKGFGQQRTTRQVGFLPEDRVLGQAMTRSFEGFARVP